MLTTNITKMDFKQLRKEVQSLRDELAIFKRKYEDAICNIDSDNFSEGFLVEQDNMKAQMKVTAEAIKFMVSDTDLKAELENYATMAFTAEQIKQTVKQISKVDGKVQELSSELTVTADGILAEVSREYETKDDAVETYNNLNSSIASISLTAEGLTTTVTNLDNFNTSVFKQSADEGFVLDGVKVKATGYITLTDNGDENGENKVERFSISHDESQPEGPQVIMHSLTPEYAPLVLGDADGAVYIGSRVSGREVATRQWVQDNAGSGGSGVAKFG